MSILIKSATLVDSKSNLNFKKKDILIKDGVIVDIADTIDTNACLLYTSPSPRDATLSRMPSSA